MSHRENEEDWVDDYDQDDYDYENEDERKLVYNNMCSDDDDDCKSYDYLNERYKKRIVKNIVVNLPKLSADGIHEEPPYSKQPEVKLNLPSGGWSVKKVEVSDMTNDMPSLSDSKLKIDKKKFSSSRGGEWKKMTDFCSSFEEQASIEVPVEQEFVKVIKKSKERVPRPIPFVEEKEKEGPPLRNLKCTKMCNSGKQCKRIDCNFAHSLEEFNPITCRFQSRCKNPHICTFKHDSETKENYLARFQSLQKK
jgi:hypothetical protein